MTFDVRWFVGRDQNGTTHLVPAGRGHRAICGQFIRSVVIGGTTVTCPVCADEA